MSTGDALNGKLVVLLGGSGFVGTHVAQELLRRGARVRIACRHPERSCKLRPLGNLGQTQFVPCDVTKPATVKAAVNGADAVVYLVGAFDGDLDAVQAKGAGSAATAAKAAGAGSFVLVSAIGADVDSESSYARSKAAGEQQVLDAFPTASILRPSTLFGEDDNFINLFARLIASFPVMPIFGPTSQLQPLLVDDAAEAVANALADPGRHGGKIFEIAGPEVLTVEELNRNIAREQHRNPAFIAVPDALSAIFAALPLTPMNRDQWTMLKSGNTASGDLPGLKALGIKPKPLALFLPRWMVRYRKHGRFGAQVNPAPR